MNKKKYLIIALISILFCYPSKYFAEKVNLEEYEKIGVLKLAPIRNILDQLNINLVWNNKTKTITFIKEEINYKLIYKPKKKIQNEFELFLIDDTGYINIDDLYDIGIAYNYLNFNEITLSDKLIIGNKVPIINSNIIIDNDLRKINNQKNKKIIFFWATWCKYCDDYIQDISYILNSDNQFDIIGVNIDDLINKNKVNEKINLYLSNGINIFDSNKEIFDIYKPEALPTTYIIENGVIIDSWIGGLDKDLILDKLKK